MPRSFRLWRLVGLVLWIGITLAGVPLAGVPLVEAQESVALAVVRSGLNVACRTFDLPLSRMQTLLPDVTDGQEALIRRPASESTAPAVSGRVSSGLIPSDGWASRRTAKPSDGAAMRESPIIGRQRVFRRRDGGVLRLGWRSAGPTVPALVSASYDEAGPGGRARPVLLVLAGDDCIARIGRRLHYGPTGRAETLESLKGADLRPDSVPLQLNPPVPMGTDPAGVAVALVDTGINYLLPQMRDSLARDRQGVILGYDYWDDDDRPFDIDPSVSAFFPRRQGTAVASVLLREAPWGRLIPYRVGPPDREPAAVDHLVDVVRDAAVSGVSIVLITVSGDDPARWGPFTAAAASRSELLFIVAAGDQGRDIDRIPRYPAALGLDSMVRITASDARGQLLAHANYGRENVDLMVPAKDIQVTHGDGTPGRDSGSPMAAARLAALAVRLAGRHPSWQASDLRRALLLLGQPSRSRLTAYGAILDVDTAENRLR